MTERDLFEQLVNRLTAPWTLEPAQDPVRVAKNQLNELVARLLAGDRTAGPAAAEAQHRLDGARNERNNNQETKS